MSNNSNFNRERAKGDWVRIPFIQVLTDIYSPVNFYGIIIII